MKKQKSFTRITVLLLFCMMLMLQLIPAVYAAKPDISPENTLPILEINISPRRPVLKDAYRSAELILRDGTVTNAYTMQIRGRGNSTWWQSKKPYHIKLDEKADLLGMGESRHWILLANAFDSSHLRNKLSYDLSAAMGMTAIKTAHVNVILNDRYVGLYQLTENIRAEKGRIPILDWEDAADDAAYAIGKAENLTEEEIETLAVSMKTNLSWLTFDRYKSYKVSDYFDPVKYHREAGYILELDEYFDEESRFKTPAGVPVMVKSPEYLHTNKKMFAELQTWILEMEEAMLSSDGYNSAGKHYSDYVDMDSFIDYWLVNELFKSVELLFKSCFMYKTADSKLTFGPIWDMDWSSGNRSNLGGDSADPCTWTHPDMMPREIWCRALYDDPVFVTAAKDRWWEIRPLIDDMMAQFDTLVPYLSAAAADDQNVWNTRSFDSEIKQLRTWLETRIQWMDKQFTLRNPDIAGFGFREDRTITMTASDSAGNILGPSSISETAARGDAFYCGTDPITVSAEFTQKNTRAILYLNGIRIGESQVHQRIAEFTVDPALLKTDGTRNVFFTIAYRGNNENGKQYMTLTAAEPEPIPEEPPVPETPAPEPIPSHVPETETSGGSVWLLTAVMAAALLCAAGVSLWRRFI